MKQKAANRKVREARTAAVLAAEAKEREAAATDAKTREDAEAKEREAAATVAKTCENAPSQLFNNTWGDHFFYLQ